MRFAPRAEGGVRPRRSRIVRASRPMVRERWVRIGSRMVGGSRGRGGISWRAGLGRVCGLSGVGVETRRYHGIEASVEVSDGASEGGFALLDEAGEDDDSGAVDSCCTSRLIDVE